jgi:hypothetical protein
MTGPTHKTYCKYCWCWICWSPELQAWYHFETGAVPCRYVENGVATHDKYLPMVPINGQTFTPQQP